MQNSKKKAPVKTVTKPFLTGGIIDGTIPKTAALFFGSLIVLGILFLIVTGVMMLDNLALRLIINGAVVIAALLLYYSSGVSQGAVAVNQGEIMYRRRENGNEVGGEELRRCYHPFKGWVAGLIGTAPIFVCALILALTATRQMATLGALPSWVNSLASREDVTDAVRYYTVSGSMSLESILRILIRILLMPGVNMVGSENPEGMLLLERLSPVLVLLPCLFYGFGYTRGVQVRTQVHTDIAANNRKRKKKASKARARRTAGPKKVEQLN